MIGKSLALGCAIGLLSTLAQAQPASVRNDYAKPETWVCWPGKAGDACAVDMTTTVIKANGAMSVEAFKAEPKAPVDCFYVYPTVSNDTGVVSDMTAGPEELNVVRAQLARLGAKCRIYAPLYRQFTLTALRAASAGTPIAGSADPAVRQVGYNDVLDAWNHYLTHENKGRGVVLVGHSQGSGVLARLIAAEIDGKPIQKQLISGREAIHEPLDVFETRGAPLATIWLSLSANAALAQIAAPLVRTGALVLPAPPPPPGGAIGASARAARLPSDPPSACIERSSDSRSPSKPI